MHLKVKVSKLILIKKHILAYADVNHFIVKSFENTQKLYKKIIIISFANVVTNNCIVIIQNKH